MFDTIHHIAIIGSDYERSKHFYVDLLGFQIIRENSKPVRCTHGKQVMQEGLTNSSGLLKTFPLQRKAFI